MHTPERLGKYELQERLGSGGMAEVWKALDTQLHRYVAIKILHADLQNDPDFIQRFLREARVVASLHHPNIMQLYDFQIARPPETRSTIAYMVMDYIEGPTLADSIARTSRQGKFPSPKDLLFLFSTISQAVDYAHQHGMIHRDIKPANILLDQRNTTHNPMGEPILTDFGLVKLLGASPNSLSGSWLGTPLYMAPEQAQGYPGDERSDIYSLGIILYELCTGILPFRGENSAAVMHQHINNIPPSPVLINQNIPPTLTMVILRCLAKDPAARFPSASSLTAALADALNLPLPGNEGRKTALSSYATSLIGVTGEPAGAAAGPTQQMPSAPSVPALPVRSALVLTPSHTPSVTPWSGSTSIPTVSAPSSYQSPPHKRRRGGLFVALIALLVLILAGSGLGAFYFLTRSPGPTADQIVGYASFLSSGQLSESSTQGNNDEMKIELQNVPDPAPGTSYYAWLLSDLLQRTQTFIALGKLMGANGSVHLFYPGDANHTNLIHAMSRLVVTEESASGTPTHPSTNKATWRYYAELPQKSTLRQHVAAIGYIRAMLDEAARLPQLGIHGGFNSRLLRNMQKVLEWVGSARDSQDAEFIRRQVIRTLDYLDGAGEVQLDVPPGTPLLADPVLSQIPLLYIKLETRPVSYQRFIDGQLRGVLRAAGISATMRSLATQADRALINNVEPWLQQIRRDAKQLVVMNNTQLSQPTARSLLDDMVTQANYAFVGRLDPATNEVQQGVVQAYRDIQLMATFEIHSYIAKA